jgi:predicted dehydrogenase
MFVLYIFLKEQRDAMVKVLMISKWHVHAEGYAKVINSQPDAKVTCVWDDDTERGAAWAKELGVPYEPGLESALARDDVDAVAVDTPTNEHKNVIIAAAKAGKHIFTEKTLALTKADAEEIAAAVKAAGVKFCISLPSLATPQVVYAKQLIDEGKIGKVHYMRMRTAHDGSSRNWLPQYWYDVEKAGGGAMMDLGCHPMYTASYLLGLPKRITSIYNNNYAPNGVDDNCVSVAEFENNAIAVLETSFVSPINAGSFEILGSEGAIYAVDDKIRLRTRGSEGWTIIDRLPGAPPVALRQWIDGIEKGTDIDFDLDKGIRLSDLLEKAYISNREQITVKF